MKFTLRCPKKKNGSNLLGDGHGPGLGLGYDRQDAIST